MTEHARDTIEWAPKRDREWEELPDSPHGGRGRGGGRSRGRGRDAEVVGRGRGRDISQLPGFRVGLRPFKGAVDGKEFCMPFNRGQECWFGANCSKWHRCNAMMPDGTACNALDHSFQTHQIGN